MPSTNNIFYNLYVGNKYVVSNNFDSIFYEKIGENIYKSEDVLSLGYSTDRLLSLSYYDKLDFQDKIYAYLNYIIVEDDGYEKFNSKFKKVDLKYEIISSEIESSRNDDVINIKSEGNDKVVLKLNEADFKDLAYAYMAYLEPHKFKRCFRCKKLIRAKDKKNELCIDCKKESVQDDKDVLKTLQCIDCGKDFYVDVRNMTKVRCDDCQYEADKVYHREYMRNRRGC
jgi:hypothetical protein